MTAHVLVTFKSVYMYMYILLILMTFCLDLRSIILQFYRDHYRHTLTLTDQIADSLITNNMENPKHNRSKSMITPDLYEYT